MLKNDEFFNIVLQQRGKNMDTSFYLSDFLRMSYT